MCKKKLVLEYPQTTVQCCFFLDRLLQIILKPDLCVVKKMLHSSQHPDQDFYLGVFAEK